MRIFTTGSIDQIMMEVRKEAMERRLGFSVKESSDHRWIRICLHPYPLSSVIRENEYHHLELDPLTGWYRDIRQTNYEA